MQKEIWYRYTDWQFDTNWGMYPLYVATLQKFTKKRRKYICVLLKGEIELISVQIARMKLGSS